MCIYRVLSRAAMNDHSFIHSLRMGKRVANADEQLQVQVQVQVRFGYENEHVLRCIDLA